MSLLRDKVNIVMRIAQDWLARLRGLSREQIYVQHVPATPRYGRAAQKLRYLLRQCFYDRTDKSPGFKSIAAAEAYAAAQGFEKTDEQDRRQA